MIAVASAAACTTSVEFEGSSSGSGASSSSATTGSGAAGGTCGAYADQTGTAVTLRIVNETGVPLYLPTLCGVVIHDIEPKGGADGNEYGYLGTGCLSSCEDLQKDGPIACAADACALVAQRVEPGATLEASWHGSGLHPTEMPVQCWFDATYGNQCQQIVAAPAGDYRYDLRGYDSCGPECSCDETGQCFGEASGLEAYHDPAVIQVPGTQVVDVVFGPCAFGCADG
jgi:hypothetical protein